MAKLRERVGAIESEDYRSAPTELGTLQRLHLLQNIFPRTQRAERSAAAKGPSVCYPCVIRVSLKRSRQQDSESCVHDGTRDDLPDRSTSERDESSWKQSFCTYEALTVPFLLGNRATQSPARGNVHTKVKPLESSTERQCAAKAQVKELEPHSVSVARGAREPLSTLPLRAFLPPPSH